MSVTVVLDGRALLAWAAPCPPRPLLAVMEVLRRSGSGRVVVPSAVVVEALTGGEHDEAVTRVLRGVELETDLPLDRVRAAADLRRGLQVSAADAILVETALRRHAAYLVTADPDDIQALCDAAATRWAGTTGDSVPAVVAIS